MGIRLAIPEEAPQLHALLDSCRSHMNANGIHQWPDWYPSTELTETDIARSQLYVLEESELVGMVVLNEEQAPEYAEVPWEFDETKVLVIHRLAVSPELQRFGHAKTLMDFAEQYAQDNAYTSIRLDTFTKNPRVLEFYKNREYTIRGSVDFVGRTSPFFCLEKEIK